MTAHDDLTEALAAHRRDGTHRLGRTDCCADVALGFFGDLDGSADVELVAWHLRDVRARIAALTGVVESVADLDVSLGAAHAPLDARVVRQARDLLAAGPEAASSAPSLAVTCGDCGVTFDPAVEEYLHVDCGPGASAGGV